MIMFHYLEESGCEALNWKSIKVMEATVDSTQPTPVRLTKLLDHFAPVFEGEMGTLAQIKAKITVEQNAQPKFHKGHPLPYFLHPKV